MPTATLTFNLPEEDYEYKTSIAAQDLANVILELDNDLRNKIKYQSDNYSEDEIKSFELVREKIVNLLSESNIYNIVFT